MLYQLQAPLKSQIFFIRSSMTMPWLPFCSAEGVRKNLTNRITQSSS
jgi:hypothetical protein